MTIAELLKSKKITHTKAAAYIKVCRSNFSRVLSGYRPYPAHYVSKLAELLDVPEHEVLRIAKSEPRKSWYE